MRSAVRRLAFPGTACPSELGIKFGRAAAELTSKTRKDIELKNLFSRAIAPCTCAVLLLALAAPVHAHERRTEGGVETVVGWVNEPAYTGFPNAVELTLSTTGGEPIVDLGADDLQVEVSFGDQKTAPMPMEPAFRVGAYGTPGEYHADLIPSRAGQYSFRFFGTINGQPFDQTYTSGEETFDSPRNPAEVSFPAQDPTAGELAASIEQLNARTETGGAGTTGMIALGLGALALLVALAAFFKKGKTA